MDGAAWLTLAAALVALSRPGRPDNASPSQIRLRGWKEILFRAWTSFNQDNIAIIGAGVTFNILLAIFPALAAFVALYGLAADVGQVPGQLAVLSGVLPRDVMAFAGDEMIRLAKARGGGLSLALVVGAAISLWSANGAVRATIVGLNVAYEAREKRGFFHLTLLSLLFTVGLILVLSVVVLALGAGGVAGAYLGVGVEWTLDIVRWPFLLVIAVGALSLLYRFGPCRPFVRWRWITWGSASATLAWLVSSACLSCYLGRFAHLGRTYGSLATVVALMLWTWLSAVIVLAGAELNCEIERQNATAQPAGRPSGAANRLADQ